MKIRRNKSTRTAIAVTLTLLLLTLGALAVKVSRRLNTQAKQIPHEQVLYEKAKPYDPKLLDTLSTLVAKIDLNRRDGALSGTLNVKDMDDSTKSVTQLSYLLCKNGKACYYRFGQVETLNAEGVFLYIDAGQKRIVIGQQKLLDVPRVIDTDSLKAAMAGENYTVTASQTGIIRTISLRNERHVTCKEYAISFDTLSGNITRLHARLSGTLDPLKKKSGKIIDLKLNPFNTDAKVGRYLTKHDVLQTDDEKVRLNKRYRDFTVTQAD